MLYIVMLATKENNIYKSKNLGVTSATCYFVAIKAKAGMVNNIRRVSETIKPNNAKFKNSCMCASY